MSGAATTPAPAAPAAAPAAVPPAPRPGWTTTEFWTTTLVHVTGLVATILVLTGHGEDLGAAEAAIPVIALIVSGALSYGYSRHRTRAKLEHMSAFVHGIAGDLVRISPVLERDAKALEPLVGAVDPAAMTRLKAAADAYKGAGR